MIALLRRAQRLMLAVCLLGAAAAPAQSSTGDYRVGPRDLLEIRVLEIPELNLERRVLESGNLDLPLLGQTSVSGLTATEVRDRLQALLTARYVNRANVSVTVKEFSNKPVTVLGAVGKPGPLNISGRWDLLQALTAAGGLAAGAGKRIHVLRRAENGLTDRLEIETAELFVKSSQIWNIPIFPSDIVNVPPRTTVKIFLLGEFKTPGVQEFDSDDQITLLPVVVRAGGLTDRAARGSIRIKRKGPDGNYQEFTVDYKRILSGKDPDPVLRPDDVVLVKESFF